MTTDQYIVLQHRDYHTTNYTNIYNYQYLYNFPNELNRHLQVINQVNNNIPI